MITRAFMLSLTMATLVSAADNTLRLNLRSRMATGQGAGRMSEKQTAWDPKQTTLIICDMWDDHWCKSAARRVAEMAGPLNEVVKQARARGVFIIHAPSSVTAFYKDTPQRRRAQAASFVKTPVPLATAERWGTAWCWTDPKREAVLPIDDSDMGCSCVGEKCAIREAWTRQIATIEVAAEDAITDEGQETWNLLAERGITNVILAGVHLNMCVLGRPFAIRQQVYLGRNVALLRDMTDTMYNPERPPGVDHFTGNDLVVGHVERHWCPSFTSMDITGKPAFRFKEDRRAEPRAARSVHLKYAAGEGDLFYNEVTVEQSTPGSYFMACGWNTGYFGMQELNSPTNKVVIFSVWDPTKGDDASKVPLEQRVEVLHEGAGAKVTRFGGEGTGGKCMWPYHWETNETCRFAVRASVEGEKTGYQGWFFDNHEKAWKHLVTFRTRTGGKPLRGLYSFIEDFRRDGRSVNDVRRARFGNGWLRSTKVEWIALNRANFTASGAEWESKENIDAGISEGRFYLATGGNLSRTRELGKWMDLPRGQSAQPPELPGIAWR